MASAGTVHYLTLEEIKRSIREAGWEPRQRNVFYQLIDERLPVMFINTREAGNRASELRYEKTHSNIVEVKAREGIVLSVLTEGDSMSSIVSDRIIEIPASSDLLSPILSIIPLQLLAYHIAVRRGCDVDQPRNLAKSVTVE